MTTVDPRILTGPAFSSLFGSGAKSLYEQKPGFSTILPDHIHYEDILAQNQSYNWGRDSAKITFIIPQHLGEVIGEMDLNVRLGEIKSNGSVVADNKLVSFVNDVALNMWDRIEVYAGTEQLMVYTPENQKLEEILTPDARDSDKDFNFERGHIPYPEFHGRYNTNPDGSFRPYGQVESMTLSKRGADDGAAPINLSWTGGAARLIYLEDPQDPAGTRATASLVYGATSPSNGDQPIAVSITNPGSGYLRVPRVFAVSNDPDTMDEDVTDYFNVTINSETVHDACLANPYWRFNTLYERHRRAKASNSGAGYLEFTLPLRMFWTRNPLYYLRMAAIKQEMRIEFYPRERASEVIVDRSPTALTGITVDIQDVYLRAHVHDPYPRSKTMPVDVSRWNASWPIREYQRQAGEVVSVSSGGNKDIELRFTRPVSELVVVCKSNASHTTAGSPAAIGDLTLAGSRTADDIDVDRFTNWDANVIDTFSIKVDNKFLDPYRDFSADEARRRLTRKFYKKTPYVNILPINLGAMSPQSSTPTGFVEPVTFSRFVLNLKFKTAFTGTVDIYALTWNTIELRDGKWSVGTA